MAANSLPSFTKTPIVPNIVQVTAANTVSDGTGNLTTPTIYRLMTAGANGSYLDIVRLMAVASVAGTATVATVLRLFLSSVTSGATTSADTILFKEYALNILTAASATLAQNEIDIPCGIWVPPNWAVLVSSHIAAATNTAWKLTTFGGDF